MKFLYQKYGDALRPVIPVVLSYKNKSIRYDALIDSGSDRCLFDGEVAELLGVDLHRCEINEVIGLGGKISFYYKQTLHVKIGIHECNMEIGFIPKIGGGMMSPSGFRGQRGFFDKFVVKFDLENKEIEIKPNKK